MSRIVHAEMRLCGRNVIYEVECDCEQKHKWTVAPDFKPEMERDCPCGRTLCLDFTTRRAWITKLKQVAS